MKKKLSRTAQNLRKKSTDAERLLWRHLRAGQIDGVKFRRQHPIGPYIVDFISLERMIVIELDGGQHKEIIERDAERDARLRALGYTVLRFWNNDALKDPEAVLEGIRKKVV